MSISKAKRETDLLIEPLQHDINVVRDKEFQVGKEFEYMLKQATQRMSDEVSRVQEDLRKLRVLNEADSLRTSVGLLEQEVTDLKNMYRIPL